MKKAQAQIVHDALRALLVFALLLVWWFIGFKVMPEDGSWDNVWGLIVFRFRVR